MRTPEKPSGRAVGALVDAPVGLQPVIDAVRTARPVLMRVAAAALDRVVDGGRQTRLIVGMDGGDDLGERDAVPAERRIEPETAGEGIVHLEAVGEQVPVPCPDDRARSERGLALTLVLGSALVLVARELPAHDGADARRLRLAVFALQQHLVGAGRETAQLQLAALRILAEGDHLERPGARAEGGDVGQRTQSLFAAEADVDEHAVDGSRRQFEDRRRGIVGEQRTVTLGPPAAARTLAGRPDPTRSA